MTSLAAAGAFAELLVKEADNNVKLIVLDRIDALREKFPHVLDGLVMDILKVLTSPDMEVKRKGLGIALEMITSRNVEEVVLFLKKQLQTTSEQDFDKSVEYRQLLIQSIHTCAIRFSEVAANVVHVLMDFLGDSNNPSAVDVVAFVRYVLQSWNGVRRELALTDTPYTSKERWLKSSPSFGPRSPKNSSRPSAISSLERSIEELCGSSESIARMSNVSLVRPCVPVL